MYIVNQAKALIPITRDTILTFAIKNPPDPTIEFDIDIKSKLVIRKDTGQTRQVIEIRGDVVIFEEFRI